MGFDGQFAKYRADELGLTHYKYSGTTVRDSRDFCRRNVGKVYSEEEIREFGVKHGKVKHRAIHLLSEVVIIADTIGSLT
jgi:hypothetical protein